MCHHGTDSEVGSVQSFAFCGLEASEDVTYMLNMSVKFTHIDFLRLDLSKRQNSGLWLVVDEVDSDMLQ